MLKVIISPAKKMKIRNDILPYKNIPFFIKEAEKLFSYMGNMSFDVEIGKIEGNASADKAQNWYSQGCKVGESIYQSPDRSDEILVYTTLFSGNGEYRYIRFVQFDK